MLKCYKAAKKMVNDYLVKDEQGATAIEYGLIAGLISAVLVTILTATGTSLVTIFTTIQEAIASAAGP